MTTILSILVLISSIALIVATLISEPVENNMSALMGGSGASDSFWGNNKGNSKEAMLTKVNIIAAVVLAVSLILLARF